MEKSAMSARNTRTSEADGLAATLEVRAEAAFELPAEPSSESATWDAVELVSVSAFAASRLSEILQVLSPLAICEALISTTSQQLY